jgi:hypothetical protein
MELFRVSDTPTHSSTLVAGTFSDSLENDNGQYWKSINDTI